MKSPLDGIRIVELTSVVLGPYACQILGDLGAEVIKIESPAGDSNRKLGPFRNHADMSALFLNCNRNKRSLVLDLKTRRGRMAALEVISGVDVLVHNFRPQAMQRLGLDYEPVKEVNPEIIYCATYGYSKRGPYGSKGALDDSIQAASGFAALQGMVGGEPRYLPTVVADKTTALMVVQAVLTALFHKQRTGEGQEIEVPMFESMAYFLMVEHLWGQTFLPPLAPAGYPRLLAEHRRPYKTKDGLYLAVLPYWDNHWKTFCEIAGRPELVVDERFSDMTARLQHIDESYAVTGEIIAERSLDEWMRLLENSSVPMMRLNSLDDLVDDPHLLATGFWQEVNHPTEGNIRMGSLPMHFSLTPATIRRLAPRFGEHSVEVLRETGLADELIQEMIDAGETVTMDDSQV